MEEVLKQLPFDEVLELLCKDAHTDAGASLLVALCKAFDLREEQYASAVKSIATWINSPNEQFRCEVVFALCSFRPVPGYGWVSIEGWKRAAIGNLHWYASAIESSISMRSQVDAGVVSVVAERLSRPAPTAESFDASYYAFLGEALDDRAIELRETGRVLGHLAGLFGLDHPSIGEDEAADYDALESRAARWQAIARHLIGIAGQQANNTGSAR